MYFPHISSPPQSKTPPILSNLNFDQNLLTLENKTPPKTKKRRFLLSKKIHSMTSKILGDIQEYEEESPLNDLITETNLFQKISQPNPSNKDFTQLNFGPRFDNNGVVVSHSIVGKVDSFMSQHHTKEERRDTLTNIKYNEPKDVKSMTESRRLNPNERKLKNSNSIQTEENIPLIGEKKNSFLKPVTSHKKPQKDRFNKEDLLFDLNLSVERHNKAKEEDLLTINSLETSDKLYLTKQTRILNSFAKYENKWKNQMDYTTRKIKRKKEASVIKNAELYRPKIEAAEAFQLTQSNYEKYGDNIWYMTLRLYNFDENETKKILFINDLPDGFRKSIVEKRSSCIEKIRKPTEEYGKDTSLLYKTFTSKDYLSQKIEKNHKILNGIFEGFKENLEDFQVFFKKSFCFKFLFV